MTGASAGVARLALTCRFPRPVLVALVIGLIGWGNIARIVRAQTLTLTCRSWSAWSWSSALRAVDGLSFRLEEGAALALVGESGSGKSTVASALLGLHRGTGARVEGSVEVAGTDVRRASDEELRLLRGGRAAMVFQDPLSSLDPYYAIGDHIAEVYRMHARVSRRAARACAVEVLDRVGIPDAARRSRSRPHEFSGGMRQRPDRHGARVRTPAADRRRADEPTTALDVTVQAQVLDLLHTLREETGTCCSSRTTWASPPRASTRCR
ncbi:ABC-type glutathione transport system ATPase component [Streptomyces collinus]|uniref:ABC-type glutathione transport system ATPase component n=1 Tax=Streptomyces collinus TaxID=42684 RepID=A0AA89QJP4_STRCU|nr:ABC-type glutathione transport system ATPase component [Streptomyces collinus]